MSDNDTAEYLAWLAEDGNGAQLLDALRSVLRRYVAFPDEHTSAAVALWIATTHALPAFDCAPRLVITSPEKRCGKTRLLDIIDGCCHKPIATVNAKVAAVFRSLGGEHPPTLVIDEADTIFGKRAAVAENSEDLRALINAGHQRGRPALRCVGPLQIPTPFDTFAMVALAGIGQMPDTITDRAVNVAMRRRSRGEQVAQFRSRRDGPILATLRDRLAAWAAERLDELAAAEPPLPVEDRAADTWEPLVSLADAAGGHWPTTARAACTALVADAEQSDESLIHRLLGDIRTSFAERGGPLFLPTRDLLWSLRGIDESPWNDPRDSLTARKLAAMLREYKIEPKPGLDGKARGYRIGHFADVFDRYLPTEASNVSEASKTTTDLPEPFDGKKPFDVLSVKPDLSVKRETAGQTPFLTGLTQLTDTPAGNGATSDAEHATALLRVMGQLGGRIISDDEKGEQ